MIFRYKIKFISDIEQKIRKLLVNIAVTPFVGVWIEISIIQPRTMDNSVTPFVGVWIEIRHCVYQQGSVWVTPFVGVWIEIFFSYCKSVVSKSLPSWECGLKYPIYKTFTVVGMSLPSWECGLKFIHVLI